MRPIPNEAFAMQLFGEMWNKQIDDISDAFYTDYHYGQEAINPADFNSSNLAKSVTYPGDSLLIIGNLDSAPLASLPVCSANTPASSQKSSFNRPSSIPVGYQFKTILSISSPSSQDIRYLQYLLIALGKGGLS